MSHCSAENVTRLALMMICALLVGPGVIGTLSCGSVPTTPSGGIEETGAVDSDGDGWTDQEEINAIPGTDPNDPTDNPLNIRDTDGHGCSDFDERNFPNFCDNDPFTVTCPTVLDDGVGFSVTVPCGFVPADDILGPIVGPSYQAYYANNDLALMVLVWDVPSGGTLPPELATYRFNGPITTLSGDFLLEETVAITGFEGERAIGVLADGSMLVVAVVGETFNSAIQTVAAGVFPTIDLQGTDGTDIIDLLAELANTLQAQPLDGFLVLEDNSVWYPGFDDSATASSWLAGDMILQAEPDSSFDDARFINMRTWGSIDVERCGTGTLHTVAGFQEPDFGAQQVVLESGAVLGVAFTDELKLFSWQVGDPVILVTGTFCSTWSTYVINLITGSAVGIP